MSRYYDNDLMVAGSGSGYGHHGGCSCSSKDGGGGGLGDLGLLAAAGLGFFLLYQAITMMRRRRKREDLIGSSVFESTLWKGW